MRILCIGQPKFSRDIRKTVFADLQVCFSATVQEALSELPKVTPQAVVVWLNHNRSDPTPRVVQPLIESGLPVLVMGRKEADNQEVTWLQSGADDYIYYPVGSEVLQARLKAHMRQMQRMRIGLEQDFSAGKGLTIDCENFQAIVNGKRIRLNERETNLLGFLSRNPRQVYSRTELLQQAWGSAYAGSERVVDMMIHRLRTKLELNPVRPQYLITVRGTGYRFDD